MIGPVLHIRTPGNRGCTRILWLALVALAAALFGCHGSGDDGRVIPPSEPSPQSEQLAVDNLLTEYRGALIAEDIDRLQALLNATSPVPQPPAIEGRAGSTDVGAFRDTIAQTFRTDAMTDIDLLEQDRQSGSEGTRVTFLEVISALETASQIQRTRVFRTTFQLANLRQSGAFVFRITSVMREGPLVEALTRGRVQSGAQSRIEVRAGTVSIRQATIEAPGTGHVQELAAADDVFQGLFTPSPSDHTPALQVRVVSEELADVSFHHRFRLRTPDDWVAQRIDNTATTSLFAVTVSPDGVVWAGGGSGGTLYQVAPGATEARSIGMIDADFTARIEDLTFDEDGRLHAVFFAPQRAGTIVVTGLGDEVVFCQTVNVLDSNYPILEEDVEMEITRPSPSTRVRSAGGGEIWLFGSDGGVARVASNIVGTCDNVSVTYSDVIRRQNSDLLSNTTLTLTPAIDGSIWFGTALGLTRLQNGQFIPVPFDPALSVQGDAATLEAFFRDVAQAIFDSRPISTVQIGRVILAQDVVKGDLIFSAAEGTDGRLWAGTLGAGLRRIEAHQDRFQDTLHLTRRDVARIDPVNRQPTVISSQGLSSNLIFALHAAPDGDIWVATNEGVSRVHDPDGDIQITHVTALDHLATPVRDVTMDDNGVVWLATDGGLFRLLPEGPTVNGLVLDTDGAPVIGADVTSKGTPFRGVTDTAGHFELTALPPTLHIIEVTSAWATEGPFTDAFRLVDVSSGNAFLEPIILARRQPPVPLDPTLGGRITFPAIPDAALELAPLGVQFPDSAAFEIGMTQLPLESLPFPLSEGFTAAVAVELQPDGLTFTQPIALTLPNQGQFPANRTGLFLFCLREQALQYEIVSFNAQVSTDGLTITGTTSAAPGTCSVLAFAAATATLPAAQFGTR